MACAGDSDPSGQLATDPPPPPPPTTTTTTTSTTTTAATNSEGAHSATSLLLEATRLDLTQNSHSYYHDNRALIKQVLSSTTDSSGSSLVDHLDQRDSLIKMKKALKLASTDINAHLENVIHLAKVLENVGTSSLQQNNNQYSTTNYHSLHQNGAHNQQETLALAYLQFSGLTGQLSDLLRNLMHSLSNRVLFPLETMLKNDIKCSLAELRRPVEKTLAEYELKLAKLDKDKAKKKQKDSNLITSPHNNGLAQLNSTHTEQEPYHLTEHSTIFNADSNSSQESTSPIPTQTCKADKEKRLFQMHLLDYLIRINEIKTRRGVDLLQNLVEHFNSQSAFFSNGRQIIEQYQNYVEMLNDDLTKIKNQQEEERRQLIQLREQFKETTTSNSSNIISTHREHRFDSVSPPADSNYLQQQHQVASNIRRHSTHGYNLHQLQGNPTYGLNKTGYLLKKSVGKMHVKAWKKRRCVIRDGCLNIYHSDKSKTPTKLSLLTCQVKPIFGDDRKCFDLISFNRTYHFQVENEADLTSWISVLINNKETALKKEFNQDDVVDGPSLWPTDSTGPITKVRNNRNHSNDNRQQNVRFIQQALINQITMMPGNYKCVDCSTKDRDVTWLSTNLGVLVCIECSGIHRDLGVHVSRIQSLTLDKIGTSQLLIARGMSNDMFNEIFEADKHKSDVKRLHSASTMSQRCEYIRSKYIDKRLCIKIHRDQDEQLESLRNSILNRDLKLLLQLLAEGLELVSYLPGDGAHSQSEDCLNETSLHLAIRSQSPQFKLPENPITSPYNPLTILDFIIQNGRHIDRPNVNGDTALHYCVSYDLIESAKLLLRSGADMHLKNYAGSSPLELAQSMLPNSKHFVELMEQSCENRKGLLEDVNLDWNISSSTLADSSCYDDGSSDEENDENICEIPQGSTDPHNSQHNSMDENDNSLSFVDQCTKPKGITPVDIRRPDGYRQRAFSEQHHYLAARKCRVDSSTTPKIQTPIRRTLTNDNKQASSYSLYQHFKEDPFDREEIMIENRSATLDRSTSICQPQASWSPSLSKSKQLSSIFGLSPRSHRFTSSFRSAKNYTPTSYLRRAVNKERMQRVRQLLRVDSSIKP